MKEVKLDLGCGKDKKEGFIGIDIKLDSDADLVKDVRKGIPYSNVSEVRMKHFLEHLTVEEIRNLFIELKKACIEGCIFDIIVPHFSSHACFQIWHKTPFRVDAFDKGKLFDNPFYSVEKVRIVFDKKWWCFWNFLVERIVNINNKMQRLYEKTGLRNLFPSFYIHFILKKEEVK